MKRLFGIAASAAAITACLVCLQALDIFSLARAQSAEAVPIPASITSCMPARIGGAMNLQSSTTLNGVTYYLYYVADLESDDGYDILVEQSGTTCHRLLGSENERVYALSHYIPFQAATQLWVGIYRHRIEAAGGVAQYQKKSDEEDAVFCPCFVSEEEAQAMRSLDLTVSSSYQPYPPEGFLGE